MRRVPSGLSLTAVLVAGLVAGCNDSPTEPSRSTAAPPVALATADNGAGLSITTDKDDYAPGDTVWFTGAGWTPGDTLNVVLTDGADVHSWSVPIDENGAFRDSTYVVDTGDLGVTFTLTATSRSSPTQTLTVTFTDANLTVHVAPLGVTAVIGVVRFDGANCTGNSNAGSNETATITNSQSFTLFGNNNNTSDKPRSIRFTAPAQSTLLANFVDWSKTASTTATIDNTARTACVSDQTGSPDITASYNAAPDLTISKALNGAFSVGTAGGTYTVTVSNGGTASATSDASTKITVTDVLPTGLTFASGGSQNNWQACTAVSQTVTCTLAPNQSVPPSGSTSFPLTVNVLATACPSVSNSASITNAGTTAESDATNNSSGNVVTTISSGCASTNNPPTADAGSYDPQDEGSSITLDGGGSTDSDGSIVSYVWSIESFTNPDGGTCSFDGGVNTGLSPTITCDDNGTLTVKLTVTDDDNATDDDTAEITVNNVAPTITAVDVTPFVSGYIYPYSSQPTIDATYTDPGSNDTHTCIFEVFDYQNTKVRQDTCDNGLGVTEAGVYDVKVTVTDDDGGSDDDTVQMVVYDPSAGFVTGGGWIYSAPGAYKDDLTLYGKGTFGFVSKYLKGATVPTGNTQFVFHAENAVGNALDFHSTAYDWLVVNGAGSRAQYKGAGKIEGRPETFTFMLTAIDGSPDRFRIQIFRPDATTLYDNYVSGSATEQALGGGSIVIQTKK